MTFEPLRSRISRKSAAFVLPALLLAGAALPWAGAKVGAEEAKPAAAAPAGAAAPASAGLAAFSPDQKKAIEAIIKEYLIANPEVLEEANQALEAKQERLQTEKLKAALAKEGAKLYRDPDSPVAGNPDGDITVAEFFDYNCGYCRKALHDIVKLTEIDPKVRVVFKEVAFIGHEASVGASTVALAARMQGKYWEVHKALLEQKSKLDEQSALKVAEKLGLDMTRLKADMKSSKIKDEIEANAALANRLAISGTPQFLVGDRSISGAPESLVKQLVGHIADLRKNGCTNC